MSARSLGGDAGESSPGNLQNQSANRSVGDADRPAGSVRCADIANALAPVTVAVGQEHDLQEVMNQTQEDGDEGALRQGMDEAGASTDRRRVLLGSGSMVDHQGAEANSAVVLTATAGSLYDELRQETSRLGHENSLLRAALVVGRHFPAEICSAMPRDDLLSECREQYSMYR